MFVPFICIVAGLCLALYAAASAGMAFDRKALVPLAGWSIVSVASWAGALAAASSVLA